MDVQNVESIVVPPTAVKRAVARKSTTKVRAVARKSTGGKARLTLPSPSDSETSSENDESSDDEGYININKITCPVMFEGSRTRVSVATLSQVILHFNCCMLFYILYCALLCGCFLCSMPIFTLEWS